MSEVAGKRPPAAPPKRAAVSKVAGEGPPAAPPERAAVSEVAGAGPRAEARRVGEECENKTVEVKEELPGKDFAKGTYFVNVFDKGELVSKSSFSLR